MAPKYIKTHAQFTQSDYAYLAGKGWANREIETRWNAEARTDAPLHHTPAVDVVGYLTQK